MTDNTDPLKNEGPTRTDMSCHECGKQFVALFDYSLTGNHIVDCAHCGHEHCRVIVNGKITEERWSSRYGSDKNRDGIRARKVWAVQGVTVQTSSASEFIRQRWLEKFGR
jgi:DNA-directed RNA polymerase subunit RPC12/RpoP